jgi:hypothetical protein
MDLKNSDGDPGPFRADPTEPPLYPHIYAYCVCDGFGFSG